VIGITLFTSHSTNSNRDGVTSDLINIASLARQYYNKPTAMGGGSNSFTGWDITTTGLSTTGSGTYVATVSAQSITLVGTGIQKGTDGTNNIQLTDYVSPAADSVVVNN
jgi:hypothetical protein